jgi:hypothetical protein
MVTYSAVGSPHITANLSGRWSGLDQEIVFLFSKNDRWCRMHRWECRLFHKGEERRSGVIPLLRMEEVALGKTSTSCLDGTAPKGYKALEMRRKRATVMCGCVLLTCIKSNLAVVQPQGDSTKMGAPFPAHGARSGDAKRGGKKGRAVKIASQKRWKNR